MISLLVLPRKIRYYFCYAQNLNSNGKEIIGNYEISRGYFEFVRKDPMETEDVGSEEAVAITGDAASTGNEAPHDEREGSVLAGHEGEKVDPAEAGDMEGLFTHWFTVFLEKKWFKIPPRLGQIPR